MSDLAIRVHGLSKKYRIGARTRYRTLRDSLAEMAFRPFRGIAGRNGAHVNGDDNTIWALRDVSFEVNRGEVVGIVGRNGAGKSTLLKVLARITEPTGGEAEIAGRVGSLLEVGTGFHHELTGRENVYLNGAILGMKRAEIDRRFDSIVQFAEVEKFLDTPVKHYSSGMFLRLAFAVAAHLDPEILLVDEVLAVGDAVFQKKCLGKMGEVAGQGRTVLFVSHNMTAVKNLCGRVIYLDRGRVEADSQDVDGVVARYLLTAAQSRTERCWPNPADAPGNDRIRLRSARIRPVRDGEPDMLRVCDAFDCELEYYNLKPDTRLGLSLIVTNHEGVCIFNSTTAREANWFGQPHPAGLFRSVCRVPGHLLNAGVYSVLVKFIQDSKVVIYQHSELLTFEVHDIAEDRGGWYGRWPGAVRPDLAWVTEHVGGEAAR